MKSRNVQKQGLSTLCIHGGEQLDAQGGIHAPLYNHSTFGFPSTNALLDVVEGRAEGNLYTRYGLNPTIRTVERKLAIVEGGEAALVFSSGMAAEAATILANSRAGITSSASVICTAAPMSCCKATCRTSASRPLSFLAMNSTDSQT